MKFGPATVLLCFAALSLSAESYDCSRSSDRRQFNLKLEDMESRDRNFYDTIHRRPVASTAGDDRSCSMRSWCLVHHARIVVGWETGEVALREVPPSNCRGVWQPTCDHASFCQYVTQPLKEGDPDSRAIFTLRPDEKVTMRQREPWYLANPFLDTIREGRYDFNGISFVLGADLYKVQHGTRYIFRQDASEDSSQGVHYVDTGVTLPTDIYEALCRTDELLCAGFREASCEALGLKKRSRRSRDFIDARRNRWADSDEGCRPR